MITQSNDYMPAALPMLSAATTLYNRTLTTQDYRNAPSGVGLLAAEWNDKPHRLVYDLCKAIESLTSQTNTVDTLATDYNELVFAVCDFVSDYHSHSAVYNDVAADHLVHKVLHWDSFARLRNLLAKKPK